MSSPTGKKPGGNYSKQDLEIQELCDLYQQQLAELNAYLKFRKKNTRNHSVIYLSLKVSFPPPSRPGTAGGAPSAFYEEQWPIGDGRRRPGDIDFQGGIAGY